MTNKQINESIHKYRGVKGFNGDLNSLSAVIYFFLMDASYQVFSKRVKPLKYKHEDKQTVSRISKAYNAFFDRFFAAFNQDERDYLIDKADEMEAHIEHHVEVARIQMMNCCIEESQEVQERLTDLWLCNRLTYEAMGHYGATWKRGGFKMRGALYTKEDRDPNMETVIKQTRNLSLSLYGEGGEVKEKYYNQLQLAMQILTKQIAAWVLEDYKKELNENSNRQKDNTAAGL